MNNEVLNDYQKDLVAKHYADALRIGQAFKSSVLYDDEKETIAVHALLQAARTYDANYVGWNNRKATFSTYLYFLVMNSLLSKGRKNVGNGRYELHAKYIPHMKLLYESTLEDLSAASEPSQDIGDPGVNAGRHKPFRVQRADGKNNGAVDREATIYSKRLLDT